MFHDYLESQPRRDDRESACSPGIANPLALLRREGSGICEHRKRALSLLIAALLAFPSLQVHARGSIGGLLQEVESELPPDEAVPETDDDEAKLDLAPQVIGQSMVVNAFRVQGNQAISTDALSAVLAPWVGRRLDEAQFRAAAHALSHLYQGQGLLARVSMTRDEAAEGVVNVGIEEIRLSDVLVESQSPQMSEERVRNWIYGSAPQDPNRLLNRLDRSLMTLNDLSDVRADAQFARGEKSNEAVMRVRVTPKRRVGGKVEVDNFGERSTGSSRALGTLNVNGALGLNEHVQFTGEKTAGTSFARVALVAPVGVDGLHLGVNAATLSERTTQPRYTDLGERGNANTSGLTASYPIVRGHSANIQALGQYNHNYLNSAKADGTGFKAYTSVYQAGLAGDEHDSVGAGGTTAGSVVVFSGNVNLNSSPSLASDAAGARTAGRFTKTRFSIHRVQEIDHDSSVFVSDSGQIAGKNLDDSEALIVGGPNGVRAYAVGQGQGSQGNLANLELRHGFGAKFKAAAFYDFAHVTTFKNANFAGAPATNNYNLQGAGISLDWEGPGHLELKLIGARRLSAPPAAVVNNFANNSGVSRNRGWLVASVPF